MGAALAVIAVLLGLAVLLLAVPIDVAFRIRGIEAFGGQVTVRWLFGLVRVRIPVPGRREVPAATERSEAPGAPERARASRSHPKRGSRGRGRRFAAVLRQQAFRSRALRLVGDLVRAARFEHLALRLRLGLGDPAETGRLWALLGPLGAIAGSLRHARVRIEPEFIDPVLEFEARGRCLLVPLRWVALVVAFALSAPAIQAWRTLGGRDG